MDNLDKNKIVPQYPSSELLFTVIQKEYDYENARKVALETRAGILITLTIAISTFILPNISLPKIKQPIVDSSTLFKYFSQYFLLTIMIVTVIGSLYLLIKVLLVNEYQRLDLVDFTEEYGKYNSDVVAMALTKKYRDIITHNHSKNNEKTSVYRIAVYFVLTLVISSILFYILMKF